MFIIEGLPNIYYNINGTFCHYSEEDEAEIIEKNEHESEKHEEEN